MRRRSSTEAKPQVIKVAPPEGQPDPLKLVAGSPNAAFNNILINQAFKSLWRAHSDDAGLDAQYQAVIAALIGIKPRDEIEGMLGTQMIATHSAAMECFRRAMLEEQTFEGRRECRANGTLPCSRDFC